jgi:hypothetical protein
MNDLYGGSATFASPAIHFVLRHRLLHSRWFPRFAATWSRRPGIFNALGQDSPVGRKASGGA